MRELLLSLPRHTEMGTRRKKRKQHSAPLSRSERMARIRKVNTKPEIAVRRLLHALGYRFRLYRRDLPGNPDIVFPGRKKAILVHGCFWHRHDCPSGRKVPRANSDYWLPKLGRNQARDAQNLARLNDLGWNTLIVWECELSNTAVTAARIRRFLD